MPVTLTPEQEAEVTDRVTSGRYPSQATVIAEALAALRQKEADEAKHAALVADIRAGLDDLAAGRYREVTATQLLAELRARRAAG